MFVMADIDRSMLPYGLSTATDVNHPQFSHRSADGTLIDWKDDVTARNLPYG